MAGFLSVANKLRANIKGYLFESEKEDYSGVSTGG